MGITKAELDAHRTEYYALVAKARAAERQGLYREALELASSSCEHIDGMIQFERKYQDKETVELDGIDMVLKYAPFLFDVQSLNSLASLLKSQPRIERSASDDISEKLSKARTLMFAAHRLWTQLEQNMETRQHELRRAIGGDQEHWRSIAEIWEKMGLVHRTAAEGSYQLTLVTDMGAMVMAKCPSCGATAKGQKARFLEELACPKCGKTGFLVLFVRDARISR
jgi:hypothetical protein